MDKDIYEMRRVMQEAGLIAGPRQKRDQQVVAFILAYWNREHTAPTLREMATGIGLSPADHHVSSIFYACQRLVRQDKLEAIQVPYGTRKGYKVVVEDDGGE